MTTYQDAVAALASASADATATAYQALPEPSDFVEVGASIVARFNLRAVALADVAFASLVRSLPLGLARPVDDLARLEGSFATLLARIAEAPGSDALARVERIGRAEPLQAAQLAYGQAIELHASGVTVGIEPIEPEPERIVIGWRRRLNPDACELCTWWARGGYVYPPDRGMRTHPSCACTQEVIFDGGTNVPENPSVTADPRGETVAR